jgi:hypothetical protein
MYGHGPLELSLLGDNRNGISTDKPKLSAVVSLWHYTTTMQKFSYTRGVDQHFRLVAMCQDVGGLGNAQKHLERWLGFLGQLWSFYLLEDGLTLIFNDDRPPPTNSTSTYPVIGLQASLAV